MYCRLSCRHIGKRQIRGLFLWKSRQCREAFFKRSPFRRYPNLTYSLARNSCLNTSMRGERVICGRGARFPQASAWRCLTFPHGVFSSLTRCTGFADSPPVDGQLQCNCFIIGNCQHRFDFASWLVCPKCSSLHCARYEYFCILQGQLLFVLGQLLWIHHTSCKVLFHWTLQYFLLQSQLLSPKREHGSLAWELGLITNQLAETACISCLLLLYFLLMTTYFTQQHYLSFRFLQTVNHVNYSQGTIKCHEKQVYTYM